MLSGILARVGSLEEVRVVCSSTSLLVAVLESFLGYRLADVLRSPSTPAERAYNLNLVIQALSLVLDVDLSHMYVVCAQGQAGSLASLA